MNIVKIQHKLNSLNLNPRLVVDGKMGPATTGTIKAFQKHAGLPETGVADSKTLDKLFPNEGDGFIWISKESLDKLIFAEVTSESVYNRLYTGPHWPGGASGVTFGIGFDLGYHTKKEIEDAFQNYVPPDKLKRMIALAGIKGDAAKAKVASVKDVFIKYETAYKIFVEVSYPKYVNQALKIYPKLADLHSNASGALVSLVYNRGNSIEGSNRIEMKNIQPLVDRKDYKGIYNQILSMRRLWIGKNLPGLLTRRDWEANLCLKPTQENSNDSIKIFY